MAAIIAVTVVGCSSSTPTAEPDASTTTSPASTVPLPSLSTTTPGDPDQTPNLIPFDVGEIPARPNGWRIGVTRVVLPLPPAGLPSPPSDQQYVGVDITMIYDGDASVTVDSRKLFGVNDQSGKGHTAISGAKGTTGLDGTYTSGTTRSGRMVFAVPVDKQLLMLMNGPVIHTQRTIFQIDPPTHAPVD